MSVTHAIRRLTVASYLRKALTYQIRVDPGMDSNDGTAAPGLFCLELRSPPWAPQREKDG